MTKVYYDTEFLDNGKTLDLISLAMIKETGESLYLINRDLDLNHIMAQPWLRHNVMRHLPVKETKLSTINGVNKYIYDWDIEGELSCGSPLFTRDEIRDKVRSFVLSAYKPELWAWYGAYDHVILCQLFGRMLDLPTGFPMYTNDLKQRSDEYPHIRLPEQESHHHHAWYDADWVRIAHQHLEARIFEQ
jgi:hypothetical protein